MKASTTFTFTGVFILVAIFYYLFGAPITEPQKETVSSLSGSMRLLPFDSSHEIDFIQVQKPQEKETTTLEKEGSEWQLKYPVNYRADTMMVEGLLSALRVSNKARRLIPEKNWDEYGLGKPEVKIGIEAKGIQQRAYLFIGDKSPVAEMIYARWEGDEEYFLLDERFKQAFDRTLYSLREKRVARISLNKANKVHIRTFTGDYEIFKQEDNWYWTEPLSHIGEMLKPEQSHEVLLALRDLYIKDFLDQEPLNAAERGILPSAPFIQIWNGEKTSVFRLGQEVLEKDSYYGHIEGEKIPLLVAKGKVETLFLFIESLIRQKDHQTAAPANAAGSQPASLEQTQPASLGAQAPAV